MGPGRELHGDRLLHDAHLDRRNNRKRYALGARPFQTAGQTVLSGWTIAATNGYSTGQPIYLSLNVRHAQLCNDLEIWQYSSGNWSQLPAMDPTYDRTYASFTVTAMGCTP